MTNSKGDEDLWSPPIWLILAILIGLIAFGVATLGDKIEPVTPAPSVSVQ